MGAENIKDTHLTDLDIRIEDKKSSGSRTLIIPPENLS